MLQELEEREVHLGAGLGIAGERAVQGGAQAQVDAAVLPGVAQLVGGDGDGGEGGGGLGLEEAEALLELGRDEVAVGPVVDEAEELDVRRGGFGARSEGDVVEDGADLGLEVEAPGGIGQRPLVGGAEQLAGAALVDERIGGEGLRGLGAAGLADEEDVVDLRGAVDPLGGAGERGGGAVVQAPLAGAVPSSGQSRM